LLVAAIKDVIEMGKDRCGHCLDPFCSRPCKQPIS
jgi:hypothetical protein